MDDSTLDPKTIRRGCLALLVAAFAPGLNGMVFGLVSDGARTPYRWPIAFDAIAMLVFAVWAYGVWMLTAGARSRPRKLSRVLIVGQLVLSGPLLYLAHSNFHIYAATGSLSTTRQALDGGIHLLTSVMAVAVWVSLAFVLADIFQQTDRTKLRKWAKFLIALVLLSGTIHLCTSSYKLWSYLRIRSAKPCSKWLTG